MTVVRKVLGIFAAILPSRYWRALDVHLPVTSSAALSGTITMAAGVLLGLAGFLDHAREVTALNNKVLLEVRMQQERDGVADSNAVTEGNFRSLSGLSLFTFIFLTPAGWAATYFTITGLVRAIDAGMDPDAAIGDPVLTGIDHGARALWGRAAHRHRESARHALEGPEVPDRAITGAAAQLAADIVIVAARQKPGWEPGTVVFTEDRCYRIGTPVERTIAGRLRTLYPLTEHRDLEAIRRSVTYTLPRLPKNS